MKKIYKKLMPLFAISLILVIIQMGCSPRQAKVIPQGDEEKDSERNNFTGIDFPDFTREVVGTSVKPDVFLEDKNVGGLSSIELTDVINEMAVSVNSDPVDAYVLEDWSVADEVPGTRVDVEMTAKAVMNAQSGEHLNLVVTTVDPSVTAKELSENIVKIAEFSTPLLDKGEGRVSNIKKAGSSIDYLVLNPGKEFSFNRVVGDTSFKNGYKLAPVIGEDNKQEYEPGGGVCQVSSTLYNAVEIAGLTVTERHKHTKAVPYIEKGRDATVDYGTLDFRFVNSRNHPIMIRVNVTEDQVVVWLLENRNI